MNRDATTRVLFVILLIAVLAAAFRVIAPFLAGFTWAAVLVATFRPFHGRLERAFGGRQWAATTTVTLLVAAFVVVPLVAAAVQAVQAGIDAIRWIDASYQAGGQDLGLRDSWPWFEDALARAKELFGIDVDVRAMAISGLARLGNFVAAKGPALVGGAFGLAFSFGMMLIGLPFLFANGERLAAGVADVLPVPTADARRMIDELTLMTRSVFMSVGVTAAVQAALGGLALLVLGVPHVVPLTAVMFFCALLPAGTAVVWVPAAIWLAATGHVVKAIVLVAWGAGVVSMIDNVLRPLLVGKGVKLRGGVLFLGMLGGLISFGLVGVFLGPIVLYLAGELLGIYRREVREEGDGGGGVDPFSASPPQTIE
jgi:predicted PurR-regulated permease PerM